MHNRNYHSTCQIFLKIVLPMSMPCADKISMPHFPNLITIQQTCMQVLQDAFNPSQINFQQKIRKKHAKFYPPDSVKHRKLDVMLKCPLEVTKFASHPQIKPLGHRKPATDTWEKLTVQDISNMTNGIQPQTLNCLSHVQQ